MSTWSDGYVSDIEYVGIFYHHQTPSLLNFVCLFNGVEPPAIDDGFDYCELGCGQGATANTLAACNSRGRFHAVDFNPAHIAHARALASEAGLTNIEFHEKSFRQMLDARADALPQFDFITLHGIYTWVGPETRREIVEVLSRCVKPGGVVAVSYNSLPGWTGGIPIQHLLMEHARHGRQRSDRQIEDSIRFAVELKEANALHLQGNPFLDAVAEKVNQGNRGVRSYLAHEYLNATWNPMFSADVGRELSEAKLDYVATADPFESILNLTLTSQQQALLQRFDSTAMRETVKDYCIQRHLRNDIFVRGARRLSVVDRDERLRGLTLALTVSRQNARFTFQVPIGEAKVAPETYTPMFDALAEGPRTVGDLIDLQGVSGRPDANPVDVAGFLVGSGQAMPRVSADDTKDDSDAKRFNRAVAARGRSAGAPGRAALAAPVIGTGLPANSVERLVYDGLASGLKADADALSRHVWQPMAGRGEAVIKDGKPIVEEAESLVALRGHIEGTLDRMVPLWQRLGAI